MYSEIVQSPQFYLDNEGYFFPEATCFLIVGHHLEYLYHLFHSIVITYFFKTFYAGGGLGEHGYRYKKAFFERLPIPCWTGDEQQCRIAKSSINTNLEQDILSLYKLSQEEKNFIESLYIL